MTRRPGLLFDYLEGVSWKTLEDYQELLRQMMRGRTGVYALYSEDQLYYVGLVSNMMTRIAAHLKDRHKGLWDHFSIYLTPDGSHMRELEALVLRIVRPTGNSVSGKFRGATDLYRSLHRAMTVHQACEQKKAELAGLQAEERALRRRLARDNAELVRLAADATKANQIAALQDRIRTAEQRLNEIQEQMEAARRDVINERDFETALSAFNPVWETLSPREQARLVRLLVERVDYDGKNGKVAVTFRPGGIKAVAQQMEEEAA